MTVIIIISEVKARRKKEGCFISRTGLNQDILFEHFFPGFPIRADAGQQIIERPAMMMMAEMAELMEDHIVDAYLRKLSQPKVENDAAVAAATPPSALHHPEGNARRRRTGGRSHMTLRNREKPEGRGGRKTSGHPVAQHLFRFGPKPQAGPAGRPRRHARRRADEEESVRLDSDGKAGSGGFFHAEKAARPEKFVPGSRQNRPGQRRPGIDFSFRPEDPGGLFGNEGADAA